MKQYLLILLLLLQAATVFPQAGAQSQQLLDQGIAAYAKGNYNDAIPLFKKCVAGCRAQANINMLGRAYNNLGNALSRTGKSEEALKCYQLSIEASGRIKDNSTIAKTSKNIGALYAEQKDFELAMQYYTTAMAYGRLLKDDSIIADCFNNIGVVYEQQFKFEEALESYQRALAIYRLANDEVHIAITLNNLSIVYKCLKDYPQSIKNYEASLALSEKLGDQFIVAANRNNLGNVYALTGNYKKSLELCRQAYEGAKAINAKEIIIEASGGIADAYEKLGQYRQALKYRVLFEQEKDSFINTERSAQLADMQVKYETTQKEGELKLLRKDKKIKQLEINDQLLRIQKRNRLLAGFLFVIVSLFVIAYFWRKSQKLKNRLEGERLVRDTEEQERLRIAKDIHDDLGSGLTKINFLSEVILQKTQNMPDIKSNSEAVQETARKMVENMRDLIWALNPDNTTLANLIARMREYASDYLEDYPADLHFTIPDGLPQDTISKESHRELLMVVKECLNNITKHSGATKVSFKVSLADELLAIEVTDNGAGFIKGNAPGNGLRNMESRLAAIRGGISITSVPGKVRAPQ
jgi:signal transduction histidine kinase